MNIDAAYHIGHTHQVCQDYTLADNVQEAVVLCDGCSSSENTDVGARILALTTLSNIEAYVDLDWTPEVYINVLQKEIKDKYQSFLKKYPTMFDATLLLAYRYFDIINVVIHGDGVVVIKEIDKPIEYFVVDSNNYPNYLSYGLDSERRRMYHDLKIEHTIKYSIQQYHFTPSHVHFPHYLSFALSNIEYVAVMSDGVLSGKNIETNEPLELDTVLNELLDFKTFTGQFVQRRLNRFLKDCEKLHWQFSDDISLGVISK